MKIKYIIFICLVFYNVFSQEHKVIRTFDSSSDLSNDLVYAVSFDNKGYCWIATDNGVYKYNGTYFKRFTIKNGLPSNDIFEIDVDSKDRKWLTGYYDGICFIENDKVNFIKTPNKKGILFAFEKRDTIFFKIQNENQLYFYTTKVNKLQKYPYKNNLVIVDYNNMTKQYLARDTLFSNFFVLNTKKQIIKKNPPYAIFYPTLSSNYFSYIDKKDLKSNSIVVKSFFPSKITIIKNDTEENIFDNSKNFKYSDEVQLLTKESSRQYKVFRGKENSYAVFKNNKYDYTLSHEISTFPEYLKSFNFINIDSKGNYWIITKNNKLVLIPKDFKKISNYSNLKLFRNDEITVISSVVVGNSIYLITNENSLCKLDIKTKEIKVIKKYDNLLCLSYKIFNHNDELIVACNTGNDFFKFKDGKLNHTLFKRELNTQKRIRNSFFLDGSIYSVNFTEIMKNMSKVIFKNNSNLRYNNIVVTKNKNIIVSNEEQIGLFSVKDENYTSTSQVRFTNVLGNVNGNILAGTNSNGLFMLSEDLKILQKVLPDENISKIHTDNYSNLIFVGTYFGLHIFKFQNQKIIHLKKISNFNGLISGKINEITSDEKSIYLFSKNGMSVIDKSLIYQDIEGEIEINNVKVGDSILNSFNKIILSRERNSLSIQTSIKTLSSEDEFEKYYSLARGEEEEVIWKKFTEAEIFFKELLPGKYVFKSYCCRIGKNTLGKIKVFSFEIKPYYWETIWFKSVIVLLIVGFFVLIYYIIRSKKIKKIKLHLKLIDLEMKALKSQMNPHFIFNTLNNMQSSVILEDEVKANNYFIKFAKLLRSTLDIVNRDNITLADEIEYINSYVAIENLRMIPHIDLIYDIDEEINLYEKSIPVMFLQPIVENAIVHGLSSLQTERKLKISIKFFLDSLLIEIEDNGVGRISESKPDKVKNHTSYATKIVSNRMKLYQELTKREYKFEIVDLIDENSKPIGTKVVLNVPNINDKSIVNIWAK